MPPCRIVILVGLPGSGKSTWLAAQGANAVSSDDVRRQLADDANDQTIHARVFATVRYLLRQRIEIGRPITYVDATHLTRRERRQYILLARELGCGIEALWFRVPLEECKRRNRERARVVPERVLDLMAARMVPPSCREGFTAVNVMAGS